MRDARSTITQQVLLSLLKNEVSHEAISDVQDVLISQLDKYEVIPRCTEVAVVDDSALKHLKDFIICKQIEGRSDQTLKRYYYELEKFLTYFRKPLSDYTTQDIRDYLEYRKRHAVYRRELSKTTLDGMRRIYSSFFAWVTAERIVDWNPSLAVRPIKHKKAVRQPYSAIEVQRIKEACRTKRDVALIDWLLTTGCRVGELGSVSIGAINWQEKSCVVTGKGDRERVVYFTDVTAMHLSDYITSRTVRSDALFLGRAGRPMKVSSIRAAVRRIGERAGVSKVMPHRFRHTFASYMCTKIPVVEVATLLGHEDISTTQIYCHNDPVSVAANYRRAMAG